MFEVKSEELPTRLHAVPTSSMSQKVMGASTRPLAEDLTCNSTLSSNIPFSTYSDLYYKERFQELKHLRHFEVAC